MPKAHRPSKRPPGRSTRAPITLGAAAACVLAVAGTATADDLHLGDHVRTIGDLGEPSAIAFAPDGRLAVTERSTGTVRIFDPASGRSVVSLPNHTRPAGIAFGADGAFFVADAAEDAVVVYEPLGGIVRTIRHDAFVDPAGIAIAGNVLWIADPGAEGLHRIALTSGEHRFVGGWGFDAGRFSRPLDVAVDAAGFVYVVDADNDRVQKLDPSGAFVAQWGESGPFEGLLDEPSSIELVAHADGTEELVVTDRRNHRVKVYDTNGTLRRTWGRHALRPREGEGALHYPDGFAVDLARGVAAVAEGFEDRIQLVELRDRPAAEPEWTPTPEQVHFGPWLSIEPPLMVLTEPEAHRVHLFDLTRELPIVIGDFGERGKGPGLLMRTGGVLLDAEHRRVELLDLAKRRVQRFSVAWEPDQPRGFLPGRFRFAEAWEMSQLGGAANGGPARDVRPTTLRRDEQDRRWAVDERGKRLLLFDDDWILERVVATGFSRPTDLALARGADGAEMVLVVDADARHVEVLARDGTRIGVIGGPERFVEPCGVAVHEGTVYVSDRGSHRVERFELDVAGGLPHLGGFGGRGTDHGLMWKPAGIAVDDRGRIVVLDFGNHRAMMFDPEGTWLATFGTGRAITPRNLRTRGARPGG